MRYSSERNSGDWTYKFNDEKEATIARCRHIDGEIRVLKLPESIDGYRVTSVGKACFYARSFYGQVSMVIPDSVTSIGEDAFCLSSRLTKIVIGRGVTSIGKNAFAFSDLTRIEVAPANTSFRSIDGVLFDKKGTTLVTFPPNRSGSYVIPDGVTNLGKNALAYCRALNHVSVPDTLTSIDSYAFSGCDALTSMRMPRRFASDLYRLCLGSHRIDMKLPKVQMTFID